MSTGSSPAFPRAAHVLSALLLVTGVAIHASEDAAPAAPAATEVEKPKAPAAVPPAVPPAAQEKVAPAAGQPEHNIVMRLGLVVQPSMFGDNYARGVDPFHPKSRRRYPSTDAVVAVPDGEAPSGRIEQLSLKGITGQGAARLALINNRPFAAGETGNVRIPGGQMQIRVLELGVSSVKVRIEGDPKTHEIKLEDRTYDFTQTR